MSLLILMIRKTQKHTVILIMADWLQLTTTVLMIPHCIVYFEQIVVLLNV